MPNDVVLEHAWGFTLPAAPVAAGALERTLAGSHRIQAEVRITTVFQVGDDPDGTPVEVLSGDVRLDGTAQIRGTLSFDTEGWTETGTGRPGGASMFPRRATDLLAPFGHEAFVRIGINLGGAGVLWTPLGYYRLETVDQEEAPDGPVSVSGSDRMAGIVGGRLVQPRVYASTTTVAAVFADLVTEIYPDALIVFDDDAGAEALGREIFVERSRYKPLQELANSLGKIMYWDGLGILRIESPPDPAQPVWEVASGGGGVLVKPSRSVTRQGVPNGMVVTGQGGDQTTNTRAVRVDANPLSPTFWDGPFGKEPDFYSSPFITNPGRAAIVAAAMLGRRLGMPHNVDFKSITNPRLQPYDPIRVTYKDGSRELHIMQALTIPLKTGAMSGTTREQTLVQIGAI